MASLFRRKTKKRKPKQGLQRQDTKPGLMKRMMSFKSPGPVDAPSLAASGSSEAGPTPTLDVGFATDLGFHHESNEDTANIVVDLFEELGCGPDEYAGTDEKKVSFFSVFDGHGGTGASYWAKENVYKHLGETLWKANFHQSVSTALNYSFLKNEEEFCSQAKAAKDMAGSCATCVLVKGNRVYCANAGDSMALIFSPDSSGSKVVELNDRHGTELKSERKRILKAGGEITPDGSVYGVLYPTRGFGDIDVKALNKDVVIAEPAGIGMGSDPHVLDVTKESFMVVASDGLWDFATREEVMSIVLRGVKRDLTSISTELVTKARMGGSEDDVTVILVKITFSG